MLNSGRVKQSSQFFKDKESHWDFVRPAAIIAAGAALLVFPLFFGLSS